MTREDYEVHKWIFKLLMTHRVNGEFQYQNDLIPIAPIELCADTVRFTVRLLKHDEIDEDRMGELILRYQLFRNHYLIRERIFYRIEILSKPISYNNFRDTLELEYYRQRQLNNQIFRFDRLKQLPMCYLLSHLDVEIRPISDGSFFHPQPELILTMARHHRLILFHGPSGNGKSFAISWLALQLKISVQLISVDRVIAAGYSLFNQLCENAGGYPKILVLHSIETIIHNPKWLQILHRFLEILHLNSRVVLIIEVRDLSVFDGTGLVGPSKFKPILFDYPNSQVMNQISQHYYQRDYTGSTLKFVPVDTIREYARTKSYEEFTTIF